METEWQQAGEGIALSALDALSTHIAILDAEGTILATNKAWRELGSCVETVTDRGAVGTQYFRPPEMFPSGATGFPKFADGVRAVLTGKRAEFEMDYLCQVRGVEKWFHGKVVSFNGPGPVRVVIAHEDITERVGLEREIVAVSAREQQRFGQELHDGLSQQLTGLKFKASILEYQLQSKNLSEANDAKAISHLLNQATDEASKLARSVQPVEIESRGLMMALRDLAARTTQLHKVACSCEIRRPVFIHDVNVATNVYRIVEEAVSNAVNHGKPRQITISLMETKDSVNVSVRDNGKGLPAQFADRAGLGLHMMRYRARMIGGALEFRRNTPKGTVVSCNFQKRPVTVLAGRARRGDAG